MTNAFFYGSGRRSGRAQRTYISALFCADCVSKNESCHSSHSICAQNVVHSEDIVCSLADKMGIPVLTFIDTPGAFAGKDAEEKGQGEAIARNLREMFSLKVPVISIVIGEGGSGGALAIGVANSNLILENAVYYVASPEVRPVRRGMASHRVQPRRAARCLIMGAPCLSSGMTIWSDGDSGGQQQSGLGDRSLLCEPGNMNSEACPARRERSFRLCAFSRSWIVPAAVGVAATLLTAVN